MILSAFDRDALCGDRGADIAGSELLAREAQLRALKAQVNPHFLFNSLNSISALTAIDPARAREMCIQLADFLRVPAARRARFHSCSGRKWS